MDNFTGEEGAFNLSSTVTTWTNVPASNISFVSLFNYSDARDSLEIDFLLEVPGNEPPGNKNASLWITAWYNGSFFE